jgi:hypothetical protein
VIVTVVPEIVQEPEPVMVAFVLALVVADTENCEPNLAGLGAPVKVTVGVAWFTCWATKPLLSRKVPVCE